MPVASFPHFCVIATRREKGVLACTILPIGSRRKSGIDHPFPELACERKLPMLAGKSGRSL